ncbi:MAG: toll/interleukin-1 receptor domain-containing protein [Planctomycetes bacterium]|nr:toll/interleukin-1 receptor domain-containing protein [Planctomycetota bacterium]
MIKTFISHTSSDHQFVEWLKTRLGRENLGLDIFVDDGSVFVGDDPQKMIDDVKRAVIFMPVLSNESIQKEFVQNEIRTAFANKTTHIFPIRLKCDDASIPEEFKTNFTACDSVEGKIYEDFSDEQEWDIHYENLRRAIFNKIVELGLFKEDTKDYYQDCEHLDLILQRVEPTILEIKTVIDVYLKKETYHRYFFSKLINAKWFKYLKLYGYLRANPQPIEAMDSPGLFRIPQWDALVYLERVSSQTDKNGEVINGLLDIIRSVTSLKDANGKHIDNYRTWYYFVKILLNLPNDKIPFDIIESISIWLDSKFSTSLPGSEIAGKLLPKFLNSDNLDDWKKAERLFEIITDIKWIPVPESQRNTYERDIEARIIIEPYWLRKGFEKRFERIGIVCSTRVIDTIAKRILTIFSKQHDQAYDVDYEGKKYQIAHSLIEDGGHKISVHSLRIPEDWDGFSQSTIGKTLVTSFDISDFENMAAFVTKVKEGLIKHAFCSLGTELDEAISSIYSLHDYTYIGYSSLSASPDQIHINDTKKILIYILKEILAVKAQYDRAESSKVLDKFLSREYPYPFFKRLVLFVAAREWDKYKEYFFKVINMEEVRCFEESDYAKELSILIKDNFSKFNPDEKEIIKKIIEAGPQLLPDENPEKYTAYWKQKWLSLMKDDPLFVPIFGEQKKVTGIEKERFNFGTEFRTSEGPGPSPLSTEEILKLTSAELAIKLKEFRSEKKWEGMTVAGFSVALKEAVMTNPSKFTDNLSHFEDVGFIYVYKILDGLKDTWKTKKTIDWGKVFDFVVPYIKKDEFWKDKYIVESGAWLGGADHGWIISMVTELIQEGTKDDSWAFPEEYFDEAKEIVFTLLQETEEVEEISDYVSHTLNTTCGKLITALVYLALRIARVNKKEGIKNDPRWTEEFKKKFDELLVGKVIDAYTSLGRFLPSLSYLDKEWVKGKIEQTISEKESKYWHAFMEGYLSVGSVYDNLYSLMRPHYEYGLSCEFKQHDREYLIQHICVGYLRGHEKLDDPESLFRKIIDAWRPEQIREVIGFFWMQRGIQTESTEENEKMRGEIIEFWRLLYEKYKGKDEVSLTQEDKHILSAVSKLTTFLSKIGHESFEWLMVSSSYVHEDFNSPFFIEYLNELKDKGEKAETAKYIGEIFLKILEKFTPDYNQEHIHSIVEFVYDAGATDIANRICNIYGSMGQEFLRDIYEKYSNRA